MGAVRADELVVVLAVGLRCSDDAGEFVVGVTIDPSESDGGILEP
jgi:hypothetical protein